LGLNSDIVVVAIARTDFSWIAIVPYIVVIVLAVVGINVFYTLIIGTLLAGIIGFLGGSFYYNGIYSKVL
jgi:Na+/H+ antiporter NhaC